MKMMVYQLIINNLQQQLLLILNILYQKIYYYFVSLVLVKKYVNENFCLEISAASGSFSTFPKFRSYEIQLRGIFPATKVFLNNISIPFESFNELINIHDGTINGYTYDGSSLSIIIYIRQSLSTSQSIQIQVQLFESITHPLLIQSPISFIKLLARCQSAKILLDYQWGIQTVYMDDYPLLLDAAATGLRITHSPINATNELTIFFTQRIPGACNELSNKITNLNLNIRNILLAKLQCNIFLLK